MKNPTAIPDTAKFPLGRIVSTPGALDACTSEYLRDVFFATFKATGALFRPMTPQKTTSPSGRALAFSRPIRLIRPIRTKAISGSLPRPIAAPRPSFCRASIDRTY